MKREINYLAPTPHCSELGSVGATVDEIHLTFLCHCPGCQARKHSHRFVNVKHAANLVTAIMQHGHIAWGRDAWVEALDESFSLHNMLDAELDAEHGQT